MQTTDQILVPGLACLLMLAAYRFFRQERYPLALALVGLAALGLRLWVGSLDPFLHDWDERFHALVARNMADHPFRPMLRTDPVAPYDFTAWCCNHIWVHKQPLFLWQMSLSIKILGNHVLAVRLPSILMGAMLVWPVFRIGQLVFNARTGFIAAWLWSCSYYSLELAGGAISMDHNDMAFSFYVTASLWAFFEYMAERKLSWLLLAGALAGGAVLCKWLAGMLVFGGIGLLALMNSSDRRIRIDGLLALGAAIVVAVPWQVYTYLRFPAETAHEMTYNGRHVTEALENHAGTWRYYLDYLGFHFGGGSWLLIAIGILLAWLNYNRRQEQLFLALFLLIPYLFFSLVAQTKLPSYVFFVAPLVILFIALLYDGIISLLPTSWTVGGGGILLCLAGLHMLRPAEIRQLHRDDQPTRYLKIEDRGAKLHNTLIYRRLNSLVPEGYVVLNAKSFEDVEAMFFSDRNVYHWWLSPEDYANVRAAGHRIACFPDFRDQVVPEYIRTDPDVLWIRDTLR